MSDDILTFAGVMMTLLLTGTLGYTAFILVGALSRRLGRPMPNELEPGELDALRAQAAELDEMRGRMAELEERVDFAERMLAQNAEPSRLAAPENRS